MEQQFILRLPEQLSQLNIAEARLSKLSAREVQLLYKGSAYPGIICRLPAVVESQKNIENKLYKIADVSTLIVIYTKKDFDIDAEISRVECSGLTPPMGHVRDLRFTTTSARARMTEEIDRKVAEMLREDARAIKVEITKSENDSSEDLDILAAEIENDLPVGGTPPKKASKPRVAAREAESVSVETPEEHAAAVGKKESTPIVANPPPEDHRPSTVPHPHEEQEKAAPIVNAELVELEKKIAEKKELLEKALNPILKKRFSQAVADLMEEYEKKKRDLNGGK